MANTSISLEKLVGRRPFGWSFENFRNFEPFEFESIVIKDPDYWHNFVSSNWRAAFYAGAVYITVIFGLKEYMKSRTAFELKWPLFWWNLHLGIFSIFGFTRMLPGFLDVFQQPNGLYSSICLKRFMDVPTTFWGLAMALSKFWELGDTLFIILRKRPLIFLQWYHHLVTMMVTWVLAAMLEPIQRWYALLNYGVHSLMYPYFALRALGVNVPTRIANLITTLQLSQMIIGLSINLISIYYKQAGFDCVRYSTSIKAFVAVYGSFMILFGKLFYDSVIKSGRIKREKLKSQ